MEKLIKKKLWEDSRQMIHIDIEYLKSDDETIMTELDVSKIMPPMENSLLTDVDKIKVSEDQEERNKEYLFNSPHDDDEDDYIRSEEDLENDIDFADTYDGDAGPYLSEEDAECDINILELSEEYIKTIPIKERVRINVIICLLYEYIPVELLKDIRIVNPKAIEGFSNSKVDEAAECGAKFIIVYRPNNLDNFAYTTNVSAKGIESLLANVADTFKDVMDWEEYSEFKKNLDDRILELLYEASTKYSDINIYDSEISLKDMIYCYSRMGEKLMSYVNGERIITNFLNLLVYDDCIGKQVNYVDATNNLIWQGVVCDKVMFVPGVCDNHVRVIVFDNTVDKEYYYADSSQYRDSNIICKADIEYGEDIIENITEYLKAVYTDQFRSINDRDTE